MSSSPKQASEPTFTNVINEYQCKFKQAPRSASQLLDFCRLQLGYKTVKYSYLNQHFVQWSNKQRQQTESNNLLLLKQQKNSDRNINHNEGHNSDSETTLSSMPATPTPTPTPTPIETKAGNDIDNDDEQTVTVIDWDSLWKEYTEQYKYQPKMTLHLWTFATNNKQFTKCKFKDARIAFDAISSRIQKEKYNLNGEGVHEDCEDNNETPSTKKSKKKQKRKKTKKTTVLTEEIFMDLLSKYRALHNNKDPQTAVQAMHFAKLILDTPFKYSDLNKALIRYNAQSTSQAQ